MPHESHDLPFSLIRDAVVTMLADCFSDPANSGKAHAKAMRQSPELLAGYLISEATRVNQPETPDSQEASEAVMVDQEQAKRARWAMKDLDQASITGLMKVLSMLGMEHQDMVEFLEDLQQA